MYLHLFLYGDKCKYIDVRSILNFQVHSLFLAAGLLEDKAREKSLVNVYTFQQPIALSKQEDFKITQTDERNDSKDCIKVSLV